MSASEGTVGKVKTPGGAGENRKRSSHPTYREPEIATAGGEEGYRISMTSGRVWVGVGPRNKSRSMSGATGIRWSIKNQKLLMVLVSSRLPVLGQRFGEEDA